MTKGYLAAALTSGLARDDLQPTWVLTLEPFASLSSCVINVQCLIFCNAASVAIPLIASLTSNLKFLQIRLSHKGISDLKTPLDYFEDPSKYL